MIVPAIIPRSLDHLEETLNQVSFASRIQIDLVDGKYNDNISWPFASNADIEDMSKIIVGKTIEVDLMVEDPVSFGRKCLAAGAKALVFHIEGVSDKTAVLDLLNEYQFDLGFALSNETPLESIYPFIDSAKFIQLMGIAEIGAQGKPFDDRVLERIVTLRALYPQLEISIDGGVSKDTLLQMKKAGANRFVSGSAILNKNNPQLAYEELVEILKLPLENLGTN